MPPRRILIDALSLTLGGGGRTYLLNLLRELERDPRSFRFTVLADAEQLPSTGSEAVEIASVQLPSASGARIAFRVAFEELALPVRARSFDLLYCPADLAPAVAVTPTVVALRNMHIYDHRYYDTMRLHVLARLVRPGVRRARRVLFPTRAAADRISQRMPIPAEKVAIVPHGVSAEAFTSPPAQEGSEGKPPYLFLPATLERHKRIDVLIRSLLSAENPELEVWLAGKEVDPEYTAELRDLARSLGLASRVRFLGSVPYGEILHYYRGAVALAFPSLLETFGHPMLEAMLAGTPIVAADIPSFHEIAGDIAVYFPPDDPEGLARAADSVLRDPDAASRRAARGSARAAEFSWGRSVDRLCGVFEDVLREHRRTSAQ